LPSPKIKAYQPTLQQPNLVTTVTSYTDSRNRALIGNGYDGVVRVVAGSYYGTGVLLYNGQAVLTAAHVCASETTSTSVMFETSYGTQSIAAKKVLINSDYNSTSSTKDLALVWLPVQPLLRQNATSCTALKMKLAKLSPWWATAVLALAVLAN
jgi:hypothetical protein